MNIFPQFFPQNELRREPPIFDSSHSHFIRKKGEIKNENAEKIERKIMEEQFLLGKNE